ncbi:MAG: helicase-exonuclease AddAB subunit AddA, partial [Limnochordia bacterium]
ELLETEYDQGSTAFQNLVDAYGGRTDENLRKLIRQLYEYATSLPQPEAWLAEAAARFNVAGRTIEDLPWYEPVVRQAARTLAAGESYFRQALDLSWFNQEVARYEKVLNADLDLVAGLDQALSQGYEPFREALATLSFQRAPAMKDSPEKREIVALRNKGKEEINGLRKIFNQEAPSLMADLQKLAPEMALLTELVGKFRLAYRQAKEARGALDFSDLEHFALRLLTTPGELEPSPIARELQGSFEEIFVDEYQDINGVQETILQLISRGDNLFMVGDVKQSIYRFRLADHRLFLNKYHQFSQLAEEDNYRIDLQTNFRSHPSLLQGINFIFRQLFTGGVAELEYPPEVELVSGLNLSPESGRLEFHLLEHEGEELEVMEREALFIVQRIEELLHSGMQVATKGGPRPLAYGDIVILLRSLKGCSHLMEAVFQRAGLPVYVESSSGFLETAEIQTMRSLLQIIDNPQQDIPLAAVLRSPLVGLTAADLARIRLRGEGNFWEAVLAASQGGDELADRLRLFLQRLEEWRTAARRCPLGALIWDIYRQTGYLDYVAGLPGGGQRQGNLKVLYQRALDFDRVAAPGLFSFLRYLRNLEETELDLGTAPGEAGAEDMVRVMSIHNSKGLEFPVVFLAGLGRQFNLDDTKGDLLVQRDLGLGPKVVDVERGIKYPSLAHRAVRETLLLESLAEEMRILYVALTRAQERLILIGSTKERDKACAQWARGALREGWPLPETVLADAKSFLDWLVPALSRHRDGEPLRMDVPLGDAEIGADPSSWQITLPETPAPDLGFRPQEMLPPELRDLEPSPLIELEGEKGAAFGEGQAKLTVSELQGPFDGEGASRGGFLRRPRFIQEEGVLTPTERGIAVHLVLQHLDLTGPLDVADIQGQIQSMVERELITPRQGEGVAIDAIVNFIDTPLGQRLCRGKLWRELPFSLRVPGEEIYGEGARGRWVLIQGVIDCLLEEEDGLVLLDFKTDRVYGPQIARRAKNYVTQMEYYKRAVEAAYPQRVKEAYLYFLTPGQLVQLF